MEKKHKKVNRPKKGLLIICVAYVKVKNISELIRGFQLCISQQQDSSNKTIVVAPRRLAWMLDTPMVTEVPYQNDEEPDICVSIYNDGQNDVLIHITKFDQY